MDEALRDALLALVRHDEAVRARLAADGSLFDGYHPEMQRVHEDNAARLAGMIARTGWPTEAHAGPDGAEAAWRIAQHAIALPAFQRDCLTRLTAAAAKGQVPAWQPAYLADRIRCFEGRPQVYGTQFDWDGNGEMSPLPIEAPETVDARRAAIGLPPLAEITARHRAEAETAPKPDDMARRRREMDEWAAKVGWRPGPRAP